MNPRPSYDAIVVGAGHAGVEASLALARSGFQTLVLTLSIDTIAKMSCNPAIGGIAKGHIVREIDALGGEMGLAIDQTGIQFRMLNRSRGPAVWAPRAQADKQAYLDYMKHKLLSQANLEILERQAAAILVRSGKVYGVRTDQEEEFFSRTVIMTTGTFLQGLIHIGDENFPGGRGGEKPAAKMSASLAENGIELIRFKTGTPPRLRAGTIRWEELEIQEGDNPPQPFSYRTKDLRADQLPCYMTYTNKTTHQIIRNNLHLSPLYAGRITGTGPRYCPSIEDKIVKFADKERHQIYLEPEGRTTDEIYVNGLSMSLPKKVQEQIVHSMKGLEEAQIVRYAYAIEYDCAPPTQLWHSLETKKIENLFFAGQINCTSGYEEAAAQGLMAGINAGRKIQGKEPLVLDRSEAYIGVLIDDLVTVGTNEPYRMFTSRAEFRLLLRQDNADARLMKYGYECGLINQETFAASTEKHQRIQDEIVRLKSTWVDGQTMDSILKRPLKSYKSLISNNIHPHNFSEEDIAIIESDVKYEGYIQRQLKEINKFKRSEKKAIPKDIAYENIRGIGREATEKLKRVRPESIGHAGRIPGISPCDLALLAIYVEKQQKTKK